jgi:hypothetical protein
MDGLDRVDRANLVGELLRSGDGAAGRVDGEHDAVDVGASAAHARSARRICTVLVARTSPSPSP